MANSEKKRLFSLFQSFKLENKSNKNENANQLSIVKRTKSASIQIEIPYVRGSFSKDANGQLKLVSPLGNHCAFQGGGGSGGCVVTGPCSKSIKFYLFYQFNSEKKLKLRAIIYA
jgi:hypothetical protein